MKPLTAKLHALLFARQQGIQLDDAMDFLGCDEAKAKQAIQDLEAWLAGSGVTLFSHEGTYALVVDTSYSASVQAFSPEQKQTLSQPMLEVLAIVAHTQPCTKQDIDDVRGVSSDQTLRNLISMGLISQVIDTKDPLKLVRYITTKSFLIDIGIKDIKELTT